MKLFFDEKKLKQDLQSCIKEIHRHMETYHQLRKMMRDKTLPEEARKYAAFNLKDTENNIKYEHKVMLSIIEGL